MVTTTWHVNCECHVVQTVTMGPVHGLASPHTFFIHEAGATLPLVFTGSVAETKNPTETEPNATEINQTVGCGCPILRSVGLLVATSLFMVYINVL
jgi:hypothetical protein